MRLNLVFHDIVSDDEEITDDFTITIQSLKSILEEINEEEPNIEIHAYFDDGYDSFLNLVHPLKIINPQNTTLAIITDDIGKKGKLDWKDLTTLKEQGVNIASHGVSHAALAVYKNNVLQNTPPGGEYRNAPRGRKIILSEQEVLFQLDESKKILESRLGDVCKFVLPYGLYNEQTIKINDQNKIYDHLSTCDPLLDTGSNLRPRYLITNKKTIPEIVKEIALICNNQKN